MIKLGHQHYENVCQQQRRKFPRYSTQLMNLANQNSKATSPKNIGSCKDAWTEMKKQGIVGTLENWEKFYNETYGADKPIIAGRRIHSKLQEMEITMYTEDLCIDYAKDLIYNKTHMGLAGEEMAVEVVAEYLKKEYRYSTAIEEGQGTDAFIDNKPVQVKPHNSAFKGHVHNHPNKDTHLIITYDEEKLCCYIHNEEFMDN